MADRLVRRPVARPVGGFSLSWRSSARFPADYAKRPEPPGGHDPDPEASHPTPHQAAPVASAVAPPPASSASVQCNGTHRPCRASGGEIAWYETVKEQPYEVWLGERLAGDVEVLSRATAAPRVYGNQMIVARSEYQGQVDATGERFLSRDIHAAVRELAGARRLQKENVAEVETDWPGSGAVTR